MLDVRIDDLPTLRHRVITGEQTFHLEDAQAYRSLCERFFAAGFDFPQCLSGVDMEYGLRSVLHLRRLQDQAEVTIWLDVAYEAPHVPSVTDLWGGLEWYEREAYDLLGINYEGHPDLRRILLEDDWEIHPLQRRYDTGGYPIADWQARPWPDWDAIEQEKEEARRKAEEAAAKRVAAAKAKAAEASPKKSPAAKAQGSSESADASAAADKTDGDTP